MTTTCSTTEAALQAGLLPAQERRKGSFAKILGCLFVYYFLGLEQTGRLKTFQTACLL